MDALRKITDTRGPHKIPENIRDLYVEHYDAWQDYVAGTVLPLFTPGERKKICAFVAEEITVTLMEQIEQRKTKP